MVCYKLSLKRLLVTFCLLLALAFLHLLITITSNDERHIDFSYYNTNIRKNENIFWINSTNINSGKVAELFKIRKPRKNKNWYLSGGNFYPNRNGRTNRTIKIWPNETAPEDDRIVNQLMYVPNNYKENSPLKRILLYNGLDRWTKNGQKSFLDLKCPVNRCTITSNIKDASNVDAILFKDRFIRPKHIRKANQVWILYLLECPYHTEVVGDNDVINWTATYRKDSDIVTPYEKWVYYDENVKSLESNKMKNFATNKTGQVAWFVSNCGARNGRLRYAKELQKYIKVDIYGFCGPLKCPRTNQCFKLLDTKYKFYLAFENSNCADYITEKFFVNGLQHNVLPIVMGARPQDYKFSAPLNSYIHVDDFESPKELAAYLHKLDQNDELYNSYFQWKGTGEFINTRFLCRLCAMLHDNYYKPKWYRNINRWWKTQETCIPSGSWNELNMI